MLNKVILMGRLTADPEPRSTTSGTSVTSFTLAVNRDFKKDGQQETDFINCVAWKSTAEFICKYFQKGQQAAVDGSIQTRSYTDRDGNKRTAFEVVVENIYFAGSKKEDGQKTTAQGHAQSYTFPENFEPKQQGFDAGQYKPQWEVMKDDELPF